MRPTSTLCRLALNTVNNRDMHPLFAGNALPSPVIEGVLGMLILHARQYRRVPY